MLTDVLRPEGSRGHTMTGPVVPLLVSHTANKQQEYSVMSCQSQLCDGGCRQSEGERREPPRNRSSSNIDVCHCQKEEQLQTQKHGRQGTPSALLGHCPSGPCSQRKPTLASSAKTSTTPHLWQELLGLALSLLPALTDDVSHTVLIDCKSVLRLPRAVSLLV